MADSNVDIVKRIYELGGTGDFQAMMSLLDPDLVVYEADSLPYGGEYRGLSGMGELMKKIGSLLDGFLVKTERFFVADDEVAALIRVTGRSRATGETIDMPVMEVWTIKNGRATAIRPFYWDTAEYSRLTLGSPK